MNVLLIDDDRELVEMLVFAFRRAGLTTTTAHDVASGLARFDQDHPELVVLDLHLGASNGFDFLRQVRGRSQVPIIILTALASEDDKVKGLSLGADDYVTKPFSHRELLTRILMRLRRPGQAAPRPVPDAFRVADIELDASAHTVKRAGQPVNLTVTEFRLLHHLLLNAGQVVPTDEILRHVWGNPDPTDSDVLRVTLHRLRRKLGETGSAQGILRTVPGVGVLLQGDRVVPAAPASPDDEVVATAETPASESETTQPSVSVPWGALVREPATAQASVQERGGRIERDGQDRLRLRFGPDAEIESVLFVTPAATLENYDPATDEVTWTMPARGERAWDVFDVARRRGFVFAHDIEVPMPSAQPAATAAAAPGPAEVEAPASQPSAAAATPVAKAPEPSSIAAFAREGAERAAVHLGRAVTVAAAAGARGRAAFSRPAVVAASALPASSAATPARSAAPDRQPLAAVPKAVPAAPRSALLKRMNELGERMSGSGRTAAMLLGVTMIAAVLSIWAEIVRLGLLFELERVGEISASVYQQSKARQLLLAFTLLVLYITSAVAFLVWINRSYARLIARRISGLRYTPTTAVIWFFVPLAFLFVPRQVVSELWHANALPEGGSSDRRWRLPMLVSVWWTAFVAFAISAVLTAATTPNPTLGDLLRQTWTNLASDALALIAAGLAIVVISAIELRQPAQSQPQRGRRPRNVARGK